MSGDTSNPRVWINADVFVGPLGTSAPTDVSTDWDAAFNALGLLSEDGLTEQRSDTLTDLYAHGNILVRTTRSKHKHIFKVLALEDNPFVFGLVNPGSTAATVSSLTTRHVFVPDTNRQAFGLEVRDGDITKRIVIPTGEVTAIADSKMSDSDMQVREMDITVYPDGDGLLYIELTDDPQAEV